MDVIINNPPAAQTFQTQGLPYAYGPQMYGKPHHDGPPVGLIALVIAGFVLFKRQGRRSDVARDMSRKFRQGRERFFTDGALDIARERYAKGEINADEYEALQRHLSGEDKPSSKSDAKPQESGDLKI